MIEIHWGTPITLIVSPNGRTQKFTTIEQACYWLHKKWPVADSRREHALDRIDAAMNCLVTVTAARKAFVSAAKSAGFKMKPVATEADAVF
ncbi:DUF982 domain-containing protein [Falsiphaeobacter marinintestinus]|uniref:DUF982 domain-containing protein n=1 Tax=Falsiphaeobacter marinintestinus TaxID=1492905 RepID=UPI0011B851AC|nr:DUF982 domain-containing protein [Phaeobacter marinintestinus]